MPVVEIEDRLVQHEELLVRERRVQLDLQHPATLDHRAHVGVEQRVAVLARRLRRVQGELRVAQQVFGRGVAAEGDADARGEEEVGTLARQVERLVQRLDHAAGERVQARAARGRFDQQHELVAAQPAHRVAGAHHAFEPFGDDLQDLIAPPRGPAAR